MPIRRFFSFFALQREHVTVAAKLFRSTFRWPRSNAYRPAAKRSFTAVASTAGFVHLKDSTSANRVQERSETLFRLPRDGQTLQSVDGFNLFIV